MVASISAMQLRASIGDVLNRIQYRGERVVVERKGEPVAAIIGVADLRRLEALETEHEIELYRLAKRSFEEDHLGPLTFGELVAAVETARGESLDLPAHV
jgi:prevent-host-death family protein